GGVFDQFGTLGTGNNERRRNLGTVGTRDGIGTAVVSAVRKRRVDFTQDQSTTFAIRANYDAVGIKEIRNGRTFAEKLGIRSNIEMAALRSVAEDDLAD